MTAFWRSSGHELLDAAPDGTLSLTDDFLRAFLARPELVPPPEACRQERAVHTTLLAAPRAEVDPSAIADDDARENWRLFLAFRALLLASPSIEAAYLRLVRGDLTGTPPLFVTQLVHVILCHALQGCTDALVLRAAELLFRPQRATTHADTVLLADAEAIAVHEQVRQASPLLAMLAQPAVAELSVLTAATAGQYWARSDAFDMVLDLGGTPSGREALGRALGLWLRHMLGIGGVIETLPAITDPDWRWFVGLDSEATRIGNALWRGEAVAEADRLLALYRLVPDAATPIAPEMAGQPIYLMLAANADGLVRLKPHNLLTLLPLAAPA